jgi:hypothetical protein
MSRLKRKGRGGTDEVPEPPPLGFVPVIVQSGLQVGRLVTALIAGLVASNLTQTQPLGQRLSQRRKVKVDAEDNDNTRVLKVQDAIKCVKDGFDSEAFTSMFEQIAAQVIVEAAAGNFFELSEILDRFVELVAACIRSKALRQDSARARVTYSYSKREI